MSLRINSKYWIFEELLVNGSGFGGFRLLEQPKVIFFETVIDSLQIANKGSKSVNNYAVYQRVSGGICGQERTVIFSKNGI